MSATNLHLSDAAPAEVTTIDLATGALSVGADESDVALPDLCGFAARNNRKRGFLFISKVLGKHWPVRPKIMQDIQQRLADKLSDTLPGPVLFIAMAETATGLGQGVFERFLEREHRAAECLFLHTTRYCVAGLRSVEFQESHSHSTDFFLYEPADADLKKMFLKAGTLILIDDELSTGNTFLNLIQAYCKINPALESICLLSITNFMDSSRRQALAQAVDIPLRFMQLLSGRYQFKANPDFDYSAAPVVRGNGAAKNRLLSLTMGRAGIANALQPDFTTVLDTIRKLKKNRRILVLGTGEFMHPAFLLARQIEQDGHRVFVQSTTRSPILPGHDLHDIIHTVDNYADELPNYLYNVKPDSYDRIIICHETPACANLLALAGDLQAQLVRLT